MLFKPQQKLTLVFINELLQTTTTRSIECTRQVEGRQAYRVHGKRKEYFLKLDDRTLAFEGLHLFAQVDGGKSNGCINFISDDPAGLRDKITGGNMNPLFGRFDLILYVKPNNPNMHFELF